MSSQIHFKFKNARESDVIVFEGAELAVDAAKRAIAAKRGAAASMARVDLAIIDAKTQQDETQYGPGSSIPKNSAVIVKIKPPPAHKIVAAPTVAQAYVGMTAQEDAVTHESTQAAAGEAEQQGSTDSQMVGHGQATQPSGVAAPPVAPDVPQTSGIAHTHTSTYAAPTRGAEEPSRGSDEVVDPTYVCFNCGARGQHSRRACPGIRPTDALDRVSVRAIARPSTGLPTGWIQAADDAAAAAMSGGVVTTDSSGEALGVLLPLQNAFAERAARAGAATHAGAPGVADGADVPAALTCPLCNKLLTEAVSLGCCHRVVCDACGRTALLASRDMTDPLCGAASSPDDFQVAREHRRAVTEYVKTGVFNASLLSTAVSHAPAPAAPGDAPAERSQPRPMVAPPTLSQPPLLAVPMALHAPNPTAAAPNGAATAGATSSSATTNASKPVSLTSGPRIKMMAPPRPPTTALMGGPPGAFGGYPPLIPGGMPMHPPPYAPPGMPRGPPHGGPQGLPYGAPPGAYGAPPGFPPGPPHGELTGAPPHMDGGGTGHDGRRGGDRGGGEEHRSRRRGHRGGRDRDRDRDRQRDHPEPFMLSGSNAVAVAPARRSEPGRDNDAEARDRRSPPRTEAGPPRVSSDRWDRSARPHDDGRPTQVDADRSDERSAAFERSHSAQRHDGPQDGSERGRDRPVDREGRDDRPRERRDATRAVDDDLRNRLMTREEWEARFNRGPRALSREEGRDRGEEGRGRGDDAPGRDAPGKRRRSPSPRDDSRGDSSRRVRDRDDNDGRRGGRDARRVVVIERAPESRSGDRWQLEHRA